MRATLLQRGVAVKLSSLDACVGCITHTCEGGGVTERSAIQWPHIPKRASRYVYVEGHRLEFAALQTGRHCGSGRLRVRLSVGLNGVSE